MAKLLDFPRTVDENAARIMAGAVALTALFAVIFELRILVWVLALGFALRAASGPRFSPLARLALELSSRIAKPKMVSGPPKRFAQAMGASLTLTAGALGLLGFETIEATLLVVLAGFASLECTLGFCLGCVIFAQFQALGWIRQDSCTTCGVSPGGARCTTES